MFFGGFGIEFDTANGNILRMKRQSGRAISQPVPERELNAPSTALAAPIITSAPAPRTTSLSQTTQATGLAASVKPWVGAALLVIAVIMVYQPVWHAGFIWDDDVYILQNKLLTAPDGLRRIWFSQDSPSQYFPLVYTTFRFEHGLWEFNPAGYHWVNILLQGANAVLLWRLLRRLLVPGAWFAAALFALHPVQVETVAWVTERKNLLSLFFFLLALRAWVEFIEERTPRRAFYAAAIGAYLLALFSKTTACTLPAAMVLLLWLREKPLSLRRWVQVTPFVLIGLAMGLLTMWWERHHIGTSANLFTFGPVERLLIASHALWFYLGKLCWPAHLIFSYPRWNISRLDPVAYGWVAACIAATVALLWAKRGAGRSLQAAFIFFVATLSPMLGFIMLFTFRYSFVADHYQYVAAIGPLTLAAAGITVALRRLRAVPFVTGLAYAIPLLGLGTVTWRQAHAYQNVESLWRDTIKKNPDSWLAHSNLGRYLMHAGRFDEAMAEYGETLRINPSDIDSLVSVGNALFGKGKYDQAEEYYDRALKLNPNNPESHINLAVILASRGQLDEAIEHDRKALAGNPKQLTAHVNLAVALAREGKYQEALEHYHAALALKPEQPLTHINLAIALTALGRQAEADQHYRIAATNVLTYAHSLIQQGRIKEAAAQLDESTRMIPNNAEAHFELGKLLAEHGNQTEAERHFVEALKIRPDFPEARQRLAEFHQPQSPR